VADKKWYVVHVYSGFERKIAEQIKQQAAQKGLADKFDEVLVPTEQVVEVRRGQKIDTDRKFFPGYVLVKMEMTDDAWHLVKDTPKVTGFLGARNKPQPVPASEAERLLKQMQEGVDKPRKPAIIYEVGEQIRVADGPFTSFSPPFSNPHTLPNPNTKTSKANEEVATVAESNEPPEKKKFNWN
jgi:transcriptional antiterminator NusG